MARDERKKIFAFRKDTSSHRFDDHECLAMNAVMKQKGSSAIEPPRRKKVKSRCPSAADNHLFPAAEDERLDRNEHFVEKTAFKHEAIYRSSAKNRNSSELAKQFRKIERGRIHKDDHSSAPHSLQATRKDERISRAQTTCGCLVGIPTDNN